MKIKFMDNAKDYIKAKRAIDTLIQQKKGLLLKCKDAAEANEIQSEINDLIDLSTKEADLKKAKRLDIDWRSISTSAVSLLSIMMVLKYEKEDIITSKAFGIATKLIK